MIEQELSRQKIIERLEETALLVDQITEVTVLEKTLREVRVLEERLQEMDEMAAKIQEVIEEELGKEEVEKLEKEFDEGLESKVQTERVVRTSVKRIETKEGEVDELEEEIKRVFLKGLLPEEEEEAEWKQESEKEVTEESLSVREEGVREKLRQIEKEWQTEVEERSGSSDVAGAISVVTIQKVESRTKRIEIVVDETRQMLEQREDVQVQASVESGEEGTAWRETKFTVKRQLKDPSQVADSDVWYQLFDRPPYRAVIKPPGIVCYCCISSVRPQLIPRILTALQLLSFNTYFCVCTH